MRLAPYIQTTLNAILISQKPIDSYDQQCHLKGLHWPPWRFFSSLAVTIQIIISSTIFLAWWNMLHEIRWFLKRHKRREKMTLIQMLPTLQQVIGHVIKHQQRPIYWNKINHCSSNSRWKIAFCHVSLWPLFQLYVNWELGTLIMTLAWSPHTKCYMHVWDTD